MANGSSQSHDEVAPERLRKQLAVAVRSIQWSYAVFWSLSTREQGVLEWGEGYYNGDIKTRKTVQAMELKADKIGLQRSKQLRELYKSLLEDETDQQPKRASPAALSPEDLTDAEWYYVVCMSFVFNPGQGLPGRALASGQTIWLCNAQYADSKVFSRSLLAKSASIQTVVCFPHLGGVIEIGVTELVSEDLNLLQHIKASLLDFSKPDCSEKLSHLAHRTDDDDAGADDDDKDQMCVKVDHEIADSLDLEKLCSASEDIRFDQIGTDELNQNHEEFNRDSPDECSNGCEQTEDSFLPEGINGGASQVQSWHFMDNDISNGVQDSMNSSDCISEAFANQEKAFPSPCRHENLEQICLKEVSKLKYTKLSSLDIGAGEDLHYTRTLSAVLGSSSKLIEHPCFCDCDRSSFTAWKKGRVKDYRPQIQQKMLKKILFTVPFMHGGSSLMSPSKELRNDLLANFKNDFMGHVNYKNSKENENFLVLKSMVPSINKTDKASILNDTIKYVKELESRVEELESFTFLVNHEARARRKYLEIVEHTSDNYDNKKIDNGRKKWKNKRKAGNIDDTDSVNLKVSVKEQEVLIDMKCPYKEYLLLDIMDAINDLHLDAHSIQSSTFGGVLTLTLKSKFRGTAIASVGMIKQALWKVSDMC